MILVRTLKALVIIVIGEQKSHKVYREYVTCEEKIQPQRGKKRAKDDELRRTNVKNRVVKPMIGDLIINYQGYVTLPFEVNEVNLLEFIPLREKMVEHMYYYT